MATITPALGVPFSPLMIVDYGFNRGSRNVIHEPLGSGFPTVHLRAAQSRAGTLTMLFSSTAAAATAEALLATVNTFHFVEAAASQDFHFIVSGQVTTTKVEGLNYWTVAAEFREVDV